MEIRQVTYFKSVAECGSFARASEKLRVAQPALSNQISKLEGRLGTKLFVRHARGIRLTESGEIFLAHASKILACIDDARVAIKDAVGEPRGVVTIGMPTTIARLVAQPLLEQVKLLFPRLDLQLVEALSGEIRQWHAASRFDLSVLYLASGKPFADTVPLLKEDLYLLSPANAREAAEPTIRFSELTRMPLYHTSRIHACRRLLDEAAGNAGIELSYIAEIDSIQLLYDFVSQKNGFSIFPCCAVPEPAGTNVRYRRIVDPDLHLSSYIVRAANRPASRGQDALLKLLPTVVAQLTIGVRDFGTATPACAA